MTFASLRALQAIIVDALDEIQAIYAAASSPSSSDSDRESQFHTPSVSASSFMPSPTKPRRPPTPPLLSIPTPTATPTRTEFFSSSSVSSASQYSQSQLQHRPHASTPPRPVTINPGLDFPSLDMPCDPTSASEQLTSQPEVANAISRIIAAAEQMAVIVRPPFLTLCDASMGYHLPSCLRFFEASHISELLKAAGPQGMSVSAIADKIRAEQVQISHILRLLATHHILLEREPDVFALNRVSALLDSGKTFEEVVASPETKYDEGGGTAAFIALNTDELFKASAYLTDSLLPHTVPPEARINSTLLPLPVQSPLPPKSPVLASFSPAMNKSEPLLDSLTPTSLAPPITLTESTPDKRTSRFSRSRSPSPSPSRSSVLPRHSSSPGTSTPSSAFTKPPTNSSPISNPKPLPSPLMIPTSPAQKLPPKSPRSFSSTPVIRRLLSRPKLSDSGPTHSPGSPSRSPVPELPPPFNGNVPRSPRKKNDAPLTAFNLSQRTASSFWQWLEAPGNEIRLARFGRAMGGSEGWEGRSEEDLCAYPFPYLASGALVVDVGGGIGSSTMRLAERFPTLKFVVQDREAVCKLGEESWRTQCPELLDSGRVRFQVHDFFTPQPPQSSPPAVFLLRVVCHDWPDAYARRILLQLRRAAVEGRGQTVLVIGEHILPYACAGEQDGKGGKDYADQTTDGMNGIEGVEQLQTLRGARWPLLANLGKASANAYWMDLTMQVTFNGQERTLPELIALTASAGWKITRVSRAEGSLFGHIIAVPVPLPFPMYPSLSGSPPSFGRGDDELPPGLMSRGSTPVLDLFGSGRELPVLAGAGRGAAGAGGEKRKRGMWVRWMRGRERKESFGGYVERGDAADGEGLGLGLVEKEAGTDGDATPPLPPLPPMPVPSPTGEKRDAAQGRGLFKKVSQYFGEIN
ncbi:hypothetical protein BV25DRAFT_1627243 [Artomyces pyxidatus]|uniref:Uncharacterized protein n=1 Tax=Artomyces pyxidatus TaxID=48021 RepID=A0ACB8SK67_9AGAM|nr:hypothetical protein BV25DRAFT_1627243 [Artomyces pyxidatus]